MTKIIIIGAGAAGLTASIFAAKNGAEVLLFERTEIAGSKILVSGGKRCNVLPEAVDYDDYFTSSSKNLMKNIFKSWNLEDCFKWFSHEIGLKMLKEKESGKWFPESESSREVRDLLLSRAEYYGVRILYNSSVNSISKEKKQWVCNTDNGNFSADKLIISTGGLSLPKIGTDGTGHSFLKKIGHSINKTYPALTPLKGKHPGNSEIPGISLDVQLFVKLPSGKKIKSERKGFLLTHRGFSGPSVLDLSYYAVQAIDDNSEKPEFIVNWAEKSEEEWKIILQNGKGSVLGKVRESLPNRLAEAICSEAGLNERSLSELKRDERSKLINLLTNYKLKYNGHEGYTKAEVTCGGIPLEEINTANLESKLFGGLFLCGEILDVFGRIGGFNFYWAWLTGRLAGISASNV